MAGSDDQELRSVNRRAPRARSEAPVGTRAWVEALGEEEIVSLSGIVRELTRLADSSASSVGHLANVVMRDPSLTSRILRAANSVTFNPSGHRITTVSRAILLVGFDTVKAFCFSAVVVDALESSRVQAGLLRQLALSFIAAVLARNLCGQLKSETREEVFVASLLLHLGRMLVWAYPHPVAEQAHRLWQSNTEQEATRTLLGTTYVELTRELAQRWKLGDTLDGALRMLAEQRQSTDDRVTFALMGDELARAIAHGWDSREAKAALADLVKLRQCSPDQAREFLEVGLREATELSSSCNDPRVTALIRSAGRKRSQRNGEESPVNDEEVMLEPDRQYQLDTLHEIMQLMSRDLSMPKLFELTLRGLHKGAGLERVILILLNQTRTRMGLKSVVGDDANRVALEEALSTVYSRRAGDFWFDIMDGNATVIALGDAASSRSDRLPLARLPKGLQALCSSVCLAGGLRTSKREIGFLFADMASSRRELPEGAGQAFETFRRQANLCLDLLAMRATQP